MKIAFISGRYSGETPEEVEWNIQAAKKLAIQLVEKGYFFFCPHLNSAHFEEVTDKPVEFWYEGDLLIMGACDFVICVPGFEQSRGVMYERIYANILGIPIFYSIDDLPDACDFDRIINGIEGESI